MKIIFFLILSILFLLGCGQKSRQEGQYPYSNIFSFLELSKTDSIYIAARFSECGEWGGHKEEIIIDADQNRNIYVHHKIYPYNCDSLEFYYANDNLEPSFNTTVSLTDEGRQSIRDYIQRLTQSKINEAFPGHAGNYFSIITSDSTFIKVYDDKQDDVDSYNKLVSELFK